MTWVRFGGSLRRSTILLLLLLPFLAPAAGAERTVDDDLELCRRRVADRKWEEALAAYDRLFEDHPGDPAVRARLRDIEDGLKTAVFRAEYEEPTPEELFGGEVKYFGKASLKLRMKWDHEPDGPRVQREGSFSFIDIRFRDEVGMVMDAYTRSDKDEAFFVLLCYDVEEKGGYLVAPGARWETSTHSYVLPRRVVRLDKGKTTVLYEMGGGFACPSPGRYKIIRKKSTIEIFVDGRKGGTVHDRTYDGGYVGFGPFRPENLEIEGRLDEAWYSQLVAGIENRAFREWVEQKWPAERAQRIPAWAREEGGPGVELAGLKLPGKGGDLDAAETFAVLDDALNGNAASMLRLSVILATLADGPTKDFLEAAVAFLGDREADAEASLDRVLAAQDAYGPALALRGLVRFGRRKLDLARADLTAAKAATPGLDWAWIGLGWLAIYDGDLEAADAILREAVAAGAKTAALEEFAGSVHRARRGPLWTKRFEVETSHFRIASDHSKELCRDVAHHLESALESYQRLLPDVALSSRRARVYVFGDREGYLGYATDRGKNLMMTAGVYDPTVRELDFFLPVDRSGFFHTVRHEGFHRFLHEYIEKAPIWFNEGCAEYFASFRESFDGTPIAGEPYGEAIETLKAAKGKLEPLSKLLTMAQPDFMENGVVHYAQAWAVVYYLMKTDDREMKDALPRYLRALVDGISAEAAFAEHIEPILPSLERRYLAFALRAGN